MEFIMWFDSGNAYDRERTLEAASLALAGGRVLKAVSEYNRALEANPGDHVVMGRLAPLLADMREFEKAWVNFTGAAEEYRRLGYAYKALGIYTLATRRMPLKREGWQSKAAVELELGLEADAVRTLTDGARHFKHRSRRADAIKLLEDACNIVPGDFGLVWELAALLARSGERAAALDLLEGLAASEQARGRRLRRVRGRIVRLRPSPANVIAWIRALLAPQAGRRSVKPATQEGRGAQALTAQAGTAGHHSRFTISARTKSSSSMS